jgi:hypothetical protein
MSTATDRIGIVLPAAPSAAQGACLWSAFAVALMLWAIAADARAEPDSPAGELPGRSLPGVDAPALSAELTAFHGRIPAEPSGARALDGRPITELAGVDYRLWLSKGPAGVAIGVGTLSQVVAQPHDGSDEPRTLVATVPTVSVGLRYRVSPQSSIYADASGARGWDPHIDAAHFNTRVGLEWKPAKSRFGFEHRSLGLQLDSGYRLSFRARSGGLAIYLRGKF